MSEKPFVNPLISDVPRKFPHSSVEEDSTSYHSLFNKTNKPYTYDSVHSSLLDFVKTSRSPKQVLQKILFSCYKDIALLIIGEVAKKIKMSDVTMITGGAANRFYNENYMTHDIDVKIYPELLTKYYNPLQFLNGRYKKYLQEEITRNVTPDYLYSYMRRYCELFLVHYVSTIPQIKEIYDYITTQVTSISFALDNSYIFDETTHKPTREKNMSALKLFVYIGDVNSPTPNGPFKLVDISMYDPSNELYATMMNKYVESQEGASLHPYIPPYHSVTIGKHAFHIMSDEFMLFEKEYLVNVYETNPYLREKFKRSIEGLRASDDVKKTHRFIGGSTRRRGKRTNRSIRRKRTTVSKKRKC